MKFEPDYRNFVDAVLNRKPKRLPLYEHIISPVLMEKVLDCSFAELHAGDDRDIAEFFRKFCGFFKEMTYDTVSYEVCICEILPGHGAIMGGKPGPIQNRRDFERYPWDELHQRYWALADKKFDCLAKALPPGMKAVGGVGNGVLEISEDLVGYEYLCYLEHDDPQLFADIYDRIGQLMQEIWATFLQRYGDHYAVCRFGDDLGFKSGTLLSPDTTVKFIVPQYRKIVAMIHASGHPFLYHSCGNIFCIMDQILDVGIQAKHSNEDAIAPFDRWIKQYGENIGLLGGIDVDILCSLSPSDVYTKVIELASYFRSIAKGYALGSGNSIPDYVPAQGYLAMISAAQEIRSRESAPLK